MCECCLVWGGLVWSQFGWLRLVWFGLVLSWEFSFLFDSSQMLFGRPQSRRNDQRPTTNDQRPTKIEPFRIGLSDTTYKNEQPNCSLWEPFCLRACSAEHGLPTMATKPRAPICWDASFICGVNKKNSWSERSLSICSNPTNLSRRDCLESQFWNLKWTLCRPLESRSNPTPNHN